MKENKLIYSTTTVMLVNATAAKELFLLLSSIHMNLTNRRFLNYKSFLVHPPQDAIQAIVGKLRKMLKDWCNHKKNHEAPEHLSP